MMIIRVDVSFFIDSDSRSSSFARSSKTPLTDFLTRELKSGLLSRDRKRRLEIDFSILEAVSGAECFVVHVSE